MPFAPINTCLTLAQSANSHIAGAFLGGGGFVQSFCNVLGGISGPKRTDADSAFTEGDAIFDELYTLQQQAVAKSFSVSVPPYANPLPPITRNGSIGYCLGIVFHREDWASKGALIPGGNPGVLWQDLQPRVYDAAKKMWGASGPVVKLPNVNPGWCNVVYSHTAGKPNVVGPGGYYVSYMDACQMTLALLALDSDGQAIAPRLKTLQDRVSALQDRVNGMGLGTAIIPGP